jgi:hypothetical protein
MSSNRRLLAAFAVLGAMAPMALAEIEGDRFESSVWRVRMTAPANWQLTEQTAYPSLLLRLERRDPRGLMLLGAEKVAEGTSTRDYAKQVSEKLEALRFEVRAPQLHTTTGAAILDFQNGSAFLRQALLVKGTIAYSLTLSAADARTRGSHLRAFDAALRSIRPLRGAAPPPPEAKEP